jgi:hypothetical protein
MAAQKKEYYTKLDAWRVARDKVSRIMQHMEKNNNLPEDMVSEVSDAISEVNRDG